ncbi:MAG: sulfatase family protein [Armatimonadota bacterium]
MPGSDRRPNVLYIMSDDHASHAMSCYGSVVNETPQMDRIAEDGVRLDNCFCTNSICTPSRASILTGKYSHLNGVFTLREGMDQRQMTAPKLLRQAGYQTAIFGKWHLGHGGIHDPQGFDRWCVLPGQGLYHDPEMFDQGEKRTFQGYATDLITDMSLEWLEDRDPDRPFFLMTHHKAPHRPWEPDEKHMHMYEDIDIPEPPTFWDDYANRSTAAREAEMRVGRDFTERDLKQPRPEGLTDEEFKRWAYQRYMQDYLRCVASVDDNVGRMLDWLDEAGLTEDTAVIYTSDQGFFLGDHGWYDKRFMYEESLRMPFVVRYPGEIPAGSVNDDIILNTDFAPLFLDYAGLETPHQMQGRSFRENLAGRTPEDWRESFYYRYFMHIDGGHNVWAHYGVRTQRYKLIFYYEEEPGPQEWELFDLQEDPMEMKSVYDDPDYAGVVAELKEELARLRSELGDQTNPWPE